MNHRTIFMLIALAALSGVAGAQNLLNQPESVVYDPDRACWLVSNYGDGRIVRIVGGEPQSVFNSDLATATGLLIRNGVLYAVTQTQPYVGLVGFDLASGELVSYLPFEGTQLLNDVTCDNAGNFYITDYYAHKIYKVPPTLDRYWLYVNFGYGMPNGLVYDAAGDRLLTVMVAAAGYPIRAVNLADSTHAVVVSTNASGMDGIVLDDQGRLYFSSWTSNSVHRYEPGPVPPHTVFSTGHAGPADIYYNPYLQMIAVPSFNRNSVEFVPIEASAVPESRPTLRILDGRVSSVGGSIDLVYDLLVPAAVRIEILDLNGRSVAVLRRAYDSSGRHSIRWQPPQAGRGVFFYRIQANEEQLSGRTMVLY